MKKSFLPILLFPLLLTGCDYSPFNNVFQVKESEYSVKQYKDYICWNRDDKASFYGVFDGDQLIHRTDNCSYFVPERYMNDTLSIYAYNENGEVLRSYGTIRIETYDQPTKIMHIEGNTSHIETADGQYYDEKELSGVEIKIPYDIDLLEMKDVEGNYVLKFERRYTRMDIALENVKLYGYSNMDELYDKVYSENHSPQEYSTIQYLGANNIDFYFSIKGINYVSARTIKYCHVGINTIRLPSVILYDGDGEFSSIGGTVTANSADGQRAKIGIPGYALNTAKLVNLLEPTKVFFTGGRGGNGYIGYSIYVNGTAGQYPINPNAKFLTSYKNSIAIRNGDGGTGATNKWGTPTDGGKTYSFNYLANTIYAKYSSSFSYGLGDAAVGSGGSTNWGARGASGTLIGGQEELPETSEITLTELEDSKSGAKSYAYNGHRYEFINQELTWEDANVAANNLGGHLITISDKYENLVNAAILERQNITAQNVWIGLRRIGLYEMGWVTGEPWQYNAWMAGEPNNANGNESYIHYSSGNMKRWNDNAPTAKCKYLIEWDSLQ